MVLSGVTGRASSNNLIETAEKLADLVRYAFLRNVFRKKMCKNRENYLSLPRWEFWGTFGVAKAHEQSSKSNQQDRSHGHATNLTAQSPLPSSKHDRQRPLPLRE